MSIQATQDFVEKNGWQEAKWLLEEWDGVTTHWHLEDGYISIVDCEAHTYVDMEYLDQLVRSHDSTEQT